MIGRYFRIPPWGPASYDVRVPAERSDCKPTVLSFYKTRAEAVLTEFQLQLALNAKGEGLLVETDVYGNTIDGDTVDPSKAPHEPLSYVKYDKQAAAYRRQMEAARGKQVADDVIESGSPARESTPRIHSPEPPVSEVEYPEIESAGPQQKRAVELGDDPEVRAMEARNEASRNEVRAAIQRKLQEASGVSDGMIVNHAESSELAG